mgnify:FL=1|tara:strand:- start:850 stop:1305 length:456 start_codon:yes stop_codon:yes gene_type:complete
MAHFAELDSDNIVKQVIVVSNDDIKDKNGIEVESFGVAICQRLFGKDTTWKQTSYNAGVHTTNTTFRGNYAGIGATYMSNVATLGVGSTDIFIEQQPYPSWTVGVTTAQWYPPANPGPAPALSSSEFDAGKYYVWNESNYQSNPATAWVLT